MSERYVYHERNLKELMHHYLGKQILVEEIQLANIQYYEGGELEEPKDESVAA
jgi:hypothetical protein